MARQLARAVEGQKPHQVTELAVTGLVAQWKKDYAPGHVYGRAIALRQVLRHFRSLTGRDLLSAVPRIPKPSPREVTATPDERTRLLAAAPPWMKCMLLLCSDLALRFAEARDACPAGWNREQHTITVRAKGAVLRTLPLTPELEELFALAPDDDPLCGFVWLLKGESRAGHYTCADHRLYAEWAKLKKKVGANPQLHFHDLRRTTATLLYNLTHDVRGVQQFLGHKSLHATAYYLAPHSPEKLAELVQLLRPHLHGKETVQ